MGCAEASRQAGRQAGREGDLEELFDAVAGDGTPLPAKPARAMQIITVILTTFLSGFAVVTVSDCKDIFNL